MRADYQTGGRGRHGRLWEAPAGENLTVSYLLGGVGLYPDRMFVLAQNVALAVRACVERLLGEAGGEARRPPGRRPADPARATCAVKWPNDVFVGDRKACGILLENTVHEGRVSFTIAGIGVNVNEVDRERYPHATSLRAEAQAPFAIERVWRELTGELETRHRHLRQAVRRGDTYEVHREYHAHLYGYGHLLQFDDLRGGGTFAATLKGVTPLGQLRLGRDGGENLYALDDVRQIGRVGRGADSSGR